MRFVRGAAGALIEDVEKAYGGDFISQEFDPYGLGGAERKNVEETTPNRELSNLLDDRYALESAFAEIRDQSLESHLFPHTKRNPQFCEVGRNRGTFLQSPQGGHQQSGPPAQESLDGLDAECPYFQMRFARLVGPCLTLGKKKGSAFAKK